MNNTDFGVAIIGCGNVGTQRAEAVAETPGAHLVMCVDASEERAKALCDAYDIGCSTDWREAVNNPDVDVVVVATSNNLHAPVGIAAMQNRKHVLCEKPLARDPNEAETMATAAIENRVRLKTGLNHRHSESVIRAKELLHQGKIGSIVFIRGWTGRGGWESLSQSWFVDPELSGGGTLMDNGQILLDLSRWFIGAEFTEAMGYRMTKMWPIAPAEDNAFGLFRTEHDCVAEIHSSWTEWRGYLYLEISGTEGYITIDYDRSLTTLGTRINRWAPIQEEAFDFSTTPDRSWVREWQEFIETIRENREPISTGYDGLQAVKLAHAVYESSESGKAVKLA